MTDSDGTFKSPALPHYPESPSSPKKIGLVTEQMEGNVEGNIDEVETAEVAAEKEAKISVQAPALHYEAPSWACEPDPGLKFQLEVLKEGKLIGAFDLSNRKNSTFVVIGRIKPGCDLVMEHPSISRYHCILQYGDDRMSKTGKGWHIFELGSTHGSRMNKKRLPPKQYIRTRVGFIFQFGESTRMYNLVGPEEDSEPEWDCSPTEMKLRKHKKELEVKLRAAAAQEMIEDEKRAKEEEGCGWGMDYGEDEKPSLATVETDAHLMEDREAYYNQDPKKALQKFFEREGFDMNFEFSEQGQGHTHKWVCSIELPVEIDGVDRAFTASATVSTSKKDAQIQCALDACRILDSYNVLRKSNTKLRMQRKTLEANDYYDEDDDLYLDRTGQLEKQREKRKQWAEEGYGHKRAEADTYESLCSKLEAAKQEILECQKHLDVLNSGTKKQAAADGGGDVLDDYISQLEKTGGARDDPKTKMEKSKWRQKLVAATHESQKLEKLVKIAKPAAVKGMEQIGTAAGDRQAFLKKLMGVRARKEVDQTPALQPGTSTSSDSNIQTPKEVTERKMEKEVEKHDVIEKPSISTKDVIKEEPKVESKTPKEPEHVEPKPEPKREEEPKAKEAFGSKVQKRVAQWEEELEAEKEEMAKKRKLEEEEEAKKKAQRVRRRDIEKKIAGTEDYGVGVEDREEKYSTWMPPNAEQSAAKQDALRAKFAGKY